MNNSFSIRLLPITALIYGTTASQISSREVTFDVTPTLTENGTVEYTPVTPVHSPGSIQIYKHTNSRTFNISAKLISRNAEDAAKNMQKLQTLRSWRYPYFGSTTTLTNNNVDARTKQNQSRVNSRTNQEPTSAPLSEDEKIRLAKQKVSSTGIELRGAPPEVLYLYGYSTSANDMRQLTSGLVNLNKIPVVLTELSITWPEDVDYIPVSTTVTNTTEMFPIKIDVSISLSETHSPSEYEKFDLISYRQGKLISF